MKLSRQFILFIVSLLPLVTAAAQQQPGTAADSIAQSKVIELLEAEHILPYYDENENTPGDYIFSSHVATIIKQKPGKNFNQYWVQVTDHRRYDDPNIYYNFYVDPKNWEVYYLDTKTDQLWTWDNWKKQRNKKQPYSPLYYPNI